MFLSVSFPDIKSVCAQSCNIDSTLSRLKEEISEQKKFDTLTDLLTHEEQKPTAIASILSILPLRTSSPSSTVPANLAAGARQTSADTRSAFMSFLNNKVRGQLEALDLLT